MRVRHKRFKVGDLVTVHDLWAGYNLPKGLPDREVVKVIAGDGGYFDVDFYGRKFRVFLANIDSGAEYECNGKWYCEHTPFIVRLNQNEWITGRGCGY